MTRIVDLTDLWEYQEVANDTPADPSLLVVPAADWLGPAPGPFGQIAAGVTLPAPNTVWTKDTGFWIRRYVTLETAQYLRISGHIEQALYVLFDGVYIGGFNVLNASRTDLPEYSVTVAKTYADAGTHEIAIYCADDNNTDSSATSYVSVVVDTLPPVFPLQPQSPVRETLQWYTNLNVSKDGTEERLRVRISPVQFFEYSYPAPADRKPLGFNMLWGNVDKAWLVPIWTQARYIGAITAGAGYDLGPVVTAYGQFPAVGYLLIWESPTNYEIVGYDSFDSNSFTLNSLVTQNFTNAWIMPVAEGYIPDSPSKTTDGYEATYGVRFKIAQDSDLDPSAPSQYLSEDYYTEEGLLGGTETNDDITTDIDVFDPGIGLSAFFANWTHSKTTRTHRMVTEGLQGAWELREFLHRRAGRHRAFWQPSFEADLRLESAGTLLTFVDVRSDELVGFAGDRVHVAVEAGGTWYFRAVTNMAQVDADTVQLTLDSALNVAASTVKRVCWLGLKRLNTDRIEIRYPGNGVAQSEFSLIEVTP